MRQNGWHFADDIFTCIFLNENIWILLKMSLKFVPEVWVNNIPSLIQIMTWRRPGDKPLSEPMMTQYLWQHVASVGHKDVMPDGNPRSMLPIVLNLTDGGNQYGSSSCQLVVEVFMRVFWAQHVRENISISQACRLMINKLRTEQM